MARALGKLRTLIRTVKAGLDTRASHPIDLGVVTHVCVCGSGLWLIQATFDDYEIATYSTEMFCAECGSRAHSPTEPDRPS